MPLLLGPAVRPAFAGACAAAPVSSGSVTSTMAREPGAGDESPLQAGIRHYLARENDEALGALRKANGGTPNDPLTNLWLGLALQTDDQPHEAMTAWRVAFGNPKWEPLADTLRGYGWWRMGDAPQAKACFEDALVNLRDSRKVKYAPASRALARLEAGGTLPPVTKWAGLIDLEAETRKALALDGEGEGDADTGQPEAAKLPRATQPQSPARAAAPKAADVRPAAGRWVGVRTAGGYQGGRIEFTVSKDGTSISDVVFIGHWYDRERRHTEPVTTGPEGRFRVKDGAFGEPRTDPKAGFGWEFEGRMVSPIMAKGTFRGYAAGIYSTGTVEWTARPKK